jgi:hypothetical protein
MVLLTCAACAPATPRPAIPTALLPPPSGGTMPASQWEAEAKPAPPPASPKASGPEWARADFAPPPPSTPVSPKAGYGQCLRSRLCELEGMCSPDADGQCIAASSEDCRPSDACLGGRCTAHQGVCIAASDKDCRGSWACKGWGRCSHDGHEACIATAQVDCQASTRCSREGECTLRGDACEK